MSERKEYLMTPEQYEAILAEINEARTTPLIALQCGMPKSPQEAANDAWEKLGNVMGFDGTTVCGSTRSPLHFTAIPKVAQ